MSDLSIKHLSTDQIINVNNNARRTYREMLDVHTALQTLDEKETLLHMCIIAAVTALVRGKA